MHADIINAVANFYHGRSSGAEAARSGTHDKQFLSLIGRQLVELGYEVHISNGANDPEGALAGHFRPAKSWDIIARRNGIPVIAIEFKGQVGSLGNNENNRYEESIGCAYDARRRYGDRICLGYLFVLGDDDEARRPNRARRVVGIDPAWVQTSHAERREMFCERVTQDEFLYDATAVLYIKPDPNYADPDDPSLRFSSFVARLHEVALARGLY